MSNDNSLEFFFNLPREQFVISVKKCGFEDNIEIHLNLSSKYALKSRL
jgi:hypothetical protein